MAETRCFASFGPEQALVLGASAGAPHPLHSITDQEAEGSEVTLFAKGPALRSKLGELGTQLRGEGSSLARGWQRGLKLIYSHLPSVQSIQPWGTSLPGFSASVPGLCLERLGVGGLGEGMPSPSPVRPALHPAQTPPVLPTCLEEQSPGRVGDVLPAPASDHCIGQSGCSFQP